MSVSAEIKELSDRHRLIMISLVLEGMSNKEVCDRFDLSLTRLVQLKKSPIWQAESKALVADHLSESKGKLREMVPLALDCLHETMKHGYVAEMEQIGEDGEECGITKNPVWNKPADRMRAAEMVLEKVGLSSKNPHEGGGNVTIQMYAPGWNNESGKGEIIDIYIDKGLKK